MTSLPRSDAALFSSANSPKILEGKSEVTPKAAPKSSPSGAGESFWQELQKASQYDRKTPAKTSPQPSQAGENAPREEKVKAKNPQMRKNNAPGLKLGKEKGAPSMSGDASAMREPEGLKANRSNPAPIKDRQVPAPESRKTDSGRAAPAQEAFGKGPPDETVSDAPLSSRPMNRPTESSELIRNPNSLGSSPLGAETPSSPSMAATADPVFQIPEISSDEKPLATQLQSLGFLLGGRDPLIEASPALALLNGKLAQIVPSEIPELIATDGLLQGILASPDIAQFFGQEVSLNSALATLGLDETELGQLVEASGMGEQTTSLGETLNALGFDVNRVQREGTLLQQTLPLEGLQPYMLRAAKLRAQEPDEREQSLAGIAGILPQINRREILSAAQLPQNNAASPEALLKVAKTAEPLSQLDLSGMSDASIDRDFDGNPILPADLARDATFNLNSAGLEDFGQGPSAAPSQAPPPTEPTMSLRTEPSLRDLVQNPSSLLPQARLSPIDPFALVGEQMSTMDKQMVNFADAPLDEAAADEAQVQDITQLFAPELAQNSMNLDSNVAPKPRPAFALDSLQGLEPQLAIASEVLSERSGQGTEDGGNQESGFQNGSGENFAHLASSHQNKENIGITGFSVRDNPSVAPQLPKEMVQKVFDNASMMLKEGGGSIRIDLGSETLGTIDLALDIKDKTVELRIIASSPQARELLAQELPKLRDSLLQQNLNLDKVEIGLNQGSAWSQSSRDGRSSQGQRQEFFEQSRTRGVGGRGSEVRSYRQITQVNDVRPNPLHTGSIQVRV